MKNIKKLVAIILAVLLAVSVTACTGGHGSSQSVVNVATLKGPTGIGLLKLMQDNKEKISANSYNFSISNSPDDVVGMISSGEADIATIPTNVAATLYAKTQGNVQVLAVNTLGVLYILQKGNQLSSIADLKGKTIYATGQGATPEYILDYLLSVNGIDPQKDVTIEYLADASELAAKVIAGDVDFCMLPEPNVTTVLKQNSNISIALNLSEEWDSISTSNEDKSAMVQGCVVVRKDWAEKNQKALEDFLVECQNSIQYVSGNVDAVAQLAVDYGIIPSLEIAKQAIPNCNITFASGQDMKDMMTGFFQVLYNADPKSIGGAMPDDAFYYMGGKAA